MYIPYQAVVTCTAAQPISFKPGGSCEVFGLIAALKTPNRTTVVASQLADQRFSVHPQQPTQ